MTLTVCRCFVILTMFKSWFFLKSRVPRVFSVLWSWSRICTPLFSGVIEWITFLCQLTHQGILQKFYQIKSKHAINESNQINTNPQIFFLNIWIFSISKSRISLSFYVSLHELSCIILWIVILGSVECYRFFL